MRLIVTAFMTLDGVIEGPGFDNHRDGKNAWALAVQNEEDEEYNREQAISPDAYLLGRKTYQIWAAFWPTATGGDDELARRINEMPKYVVSNTLKTADWTNAQGEPGAPLARTQDAVALGRTPPDEDVANGVIWPS
ncbi:MAG TPA: dihydrofolate reductase family protein [Acidimicrobiia bacterium]|nr:dihydrofolate reductase family protein [Acidimicrobiia bacterium]